MLITKMLLIALSEMENYRFAGFWACNFRGLYCKRHRPRAVKVPNGIKDSELRSRMKEKYGIMISGGTEKLRGKSSESATWGITASSEYILPLFAALESSLIELGYKFKRGEGIDAAAEIIKEIQPLPEPSPL